MESSRPKEERKTKEHITPGNGNKHEKNEQELDGIRKEGPGQSGLENAGRWPMVHWELLLYDLPFLSYALSINYYLPHSQPYLANSCTSIVFHFMIRYGLSGWYINPVCLKYMIYITEADIGVLDITGWARRKAGSIRTLDCSYGFYTSSVRSIIQCSLVSGMITYTLTGYSGHKL
ncbi:unnamed protein product [Schistosoma margrebowiei]|uniref:Uncharacterized protein n=1 Tax=Schistosoma margrebowiei TaxID=48269 RepID=A0A183LCL0_9TREM|nr:unnamed protein product [Schistosoma margrebowiei]